MADRRIEKEPSGLNGLSTIDDRSILDLVHESIFARERDLTITYWNAAAEQLYGWTRDEAIGRNAIELLHCDHEMSVEQCEAELFATGQWQGELTRKTKFGEELLIEVTWAVRRDTKGEPVEIIETGRDITRRRQREAALRLNEERYRNLFDVMAVSFWEIDFNAVGSTLISLMETGDLSLLRDRLMSDRALVRRCMELSLVLDANAKTLELFGAEAKDQIVGGDVARFWPPESEEVFIEALMATMERRPNLVTETKLLRLNGEQIDVLFTVAWSPDSRRRGIVVLGVIDISERHAALRALAESEQKYRDLFQYMPIALWQIDTHEMRAMFDQLLDQGVDDLVAHVRDHPEVLDQAKATIKVVEANDQTLKLFGANSREELLDWMPANWVSRDDWARAAMARLAGASHFIAESTIRRMDGTLVDVLFSATFADRQDPQSVNLVGAVDISDRTAAQRKLREIELEFAHAARVATLGELTASIAHEVNQPLAAIATNGEASLRWLNRAEPNIDEVSRLAARIVADARRAADIISHIRAMATKRTPDRTDVDINALVVETMQFLQREVQGKGIVVRYEMAPDLPTVTCDRTQIQQVIVNLVVNAAHAMESVPTTRRQLVLRTHFDHSRLRVEVEDSGSGVPKEHLSNLFNSFFTTRESGLGIGLSICRSIIEAHCGEIACMNLPSGALFSFSLPTSA